MRQNDLVTDIQSLAINCGYENDDDAIGCDYDYEMDDDYVNGGGGDDDDDLGVNDDDDCVGRPQLQAQLLGRHCDGGYYDGSAEHTGHVSELDKYFAQVQILGLARHLGGRSELCKLAI